jgi:hypothetical protein
MTQITSETLLERAAALLEFARNRHDDARYSEWLDDLETYRTWQLIDAQLAKEVRDGKENHA